MAARSSPSTTSRRTSRFDARIRCRAQAFRAARGAPVPARIAEGLSMPHGDMFLKVESARAGAVKGEAMDSVHGGEIDVVDWSWGMSSPHALAGAGPAQRSALSELRIVKRADLA